MRNKNFTFSQFDGSFEDLQIVGSFEILTVRFDVAREVQSVDLQRDKSSISILAFVHQSNSLQR
jgi:hypothetical protein